MNIGVETYEAMTPQCLRSVVQSGYRSGDLLSYEAPMWEDNGSVDIGVVIYEPMTPQCGRSVVQVLVVKSEYRSGDL